MKKRIIFLGLYLSAAVASAQLIDEVVLVVNDTVLTATEYSALVKLQSGSDDSPSNQPTLGSPVTERIINDVLLVERARAVINKPIDTGQIDTALQRLATNQNFTVPQYLAHMRQVGIEEDVLRDGVEQRILLDQVIMRNLSSKVTVSEKDVEQYMKANPGLKALDDAQYELVHVYIDIDLDLSKKDRGQRKDEAELLRSDFLEGVSIDVLLEKYPHAKTTEEQGYLGWKSPNELPDLFLTALRGVDQNGFSAVIESPNGFHLLKVLGQRGGATVDQYKVRHILRAFKSDADEKEALETIRSIRQQILQGGSFAELAKSYSQDKGSAVQDGELGWILPDKMVPTFRDAVLSLSANTLSQPVRSQYGYHLIEVQGKRAAQTGVSKTEMRARRAIFQKKLNDETIELIDDLRQRAFIEVIGG